jgi:hypothetical protein
VFDGENGIKTKVKVNSLGMTTTDSPVNFLRAELGLVSKVCSFEKGNTCACPLQEIREKSLKEIMECLEELSEEAIMNIHTYCQLCGERHIWQNKDKVPLSQDDF